MTSASLSLLRRDVLLVRLGAAVLLQRVRLGLDLRDVHAVAEALGAVHDAVVDVVDDRRLVHVEDVGPVNAGAHEVVDAQPRLVGAHGAPRRLEDVLAEAVEGVERRVRDVLLLDALNQLAVRKARRASL